MQSSFGATVSIIIFALFFCPQSPTVAALSWTCSLASRPLENIPISPEEQQEILRQQQQHSLDRKRNLLRFPWIMGAIVVPAEQAEEDKQHRRQMTTTTAGDENSTPISLFKQAVAVTTTANTTTTTNSTSGTTVFHEGRYCGCANSFLFSNGVINQDVKYYCPLPANQCSVWVTQSGDDYDYGVQCFDDMSWAVQTARQLWYYIVFWFVLLALYPIFTRPGHHAVKYVLSRCCPRINVWITEQLLEEEIRTNERIREEFEQAARLRRQRDGEITGYSIRTKRHSKIVAFTESDKVSCNTVDASGDEPTTIVGVVAGMKDVTSPRTFSEEGTMCTICLLELEDGDRIADLGCGHLYHAECLGEWVLKKNTCPLCQDQGVATEIRYYEKIDDGNCNDVVSRGSGRRHKMRRMFLNFVTGGHPPSRDDQIRT